MDSLITASESFYDNSKEEEVNVDLFNSFMKRITIWDYSCITREHYLSLPNHEKESMLIYYYEMKSRTCGKTLLFLIEKEAAWNVFC